MSNIDEDLYMPHQKISYLQSRDPSILTWNKYGLNKVRVNLNFSSDESSVQSTVLKEEEKHLGVYLRIKGGVEISSIYKIEDDTFICDLSDSSINNKIAAQTEEKYKFSTIFGPERTQRFIFDVTVKEKVLKFINGENSTIMAYGSSGSGKTFTLIGTPVDPGIIPRAIKYLFHSLPILKEYPQAKPLPNGQAVILDDNQKIAEKRETFNILKDLPNCKDHARAFNAMQERLSMDPVAVVENITPIISLWISLCEIYNEQVYDLLQPLLKGQCRPKLKIGGLQDNIYIKDLKYVNVRSGLEAYGILQYGLQNRNKASTAINLQSSRSHCIFTIKLVQGYNSENLLISSFNFCDLAGSERLKKTLNVGDRLRESNSINNSLLVLGRCITMVRDGQDKKQNIMPPFRESKLTHLFQKAILGKENIDLMITINPSKNMFAENQHTLNFSAIAKEVVIDKTPVKVLNSSRFLDLDNASREDEIMDLRYTIRELRDKLTEFEDENRVLRDEKANLVLQLSEERLQHEEDIDKERDHLIKGYREMISIKDEQIDTLKRDNEALSKQIRKLQKINQLTVLNSSDSSDDVNNSIHNSDIVIDDDDDDVVNSIHNNDMGVDDDNDMGVGDDDICVDDDNDKNNYN
ncbi:kinesin-like protein subito [Rhynchophorus ferrugineus]|uniref:kinesin-like protein subito n=1 Tax=Rhynchophorus ferrugineus TaxID=354439 RepID=UPI003FCD8DC2